MRSESEDAALNLKVKNEQFALLFKASRASGPSAFFIALVYWVFLYSQLHDPLILYWGVAMHASQIARHHWVLHYNDSLEQVIQSRAWVRFLVFLFGLNGALWGMAPLLFLPPNDPLLAAFMLMVTLGIFVGALAWISPVKAAMISFCVPILVLLTLALVTQDALAYRVAAIFTSIYMFDAWKFSMQHHKLLTDSLITRFEKAALVEQLEHQVELVNKASQEKTRFLAAASHDLRQPLHAIALFSAVLEKELQGGPHYDTAHRLLNSVRLLGHSLDGMLDISSLDAGTVSAAKEPVPLQRVFEALDCVFSAQADERGLQLRIRPTDIWVRTDAELIHRMLANLLANALKYTAEGGVLMVARQRNGEVWVDVRDTGVGIAPDQMDRIFDEFYQVGNPGRNAAIGLGIGLSIVRRLSTLLKHPIRVTSSPGRGSTFRVVLQCVQPAKAAFDPERSGPYFTNLVLPQRVLVLDDEPEILRAISSLLESYGVKSTCVGTPEMALEALGAQHVNGRYDFMLCDFRLANGEDGLAFGVSIQSRFQHEIKVIVITGETGPENLKRLQESGLQVLFKPATAGTLLRAISQRP